MRLLLLTYLLASVYAAPAERTKRNILPGDPRYDAKHHHEHDEHKHHENEIEISKALGGFTGASSVPEISFGSSGLETGASIGSTDILDHNTHASKAALVIDAVKVAGSKVSEELQSDTENSFTIPAVKSVSVVKASDSATPTEFVGLASRSKDVDANEGSFKNTGETKIETKSASDKTSTVASQTTIKSGSTDTKSAIEAFSSDFGLATDILATPFFGSSFDSSLSSLSQSEYHPSFYSASEYNTPRFDGFNTNFDYYNSNGGLPSNLGTYSGLDQIFKGHTIDANIPVDFSQSDLIDFTKNVPYLAPSSSSSFVSDTEANPAEFKFNNAGSYLSLPVGAEYQHLFKGNNPFSPAQPMPASFQSKFQSEGSYSGVSQLTDTSGGYVY